MVQQRIGLVLVLAGGALILLAAVMINPFASLAGSPLSPTPTAAAVAALPSPTAAPTLAPTAPPTPTLAPSPTPRPALAPVASPTAAPATATPVPPAAAPTATPAPQPAAGLPARIVIPKLGIDTSVEYVGLTPDGAMDVPKRFDTVGWYELGPRPGDLGNAVMAGHLDSKTGPAIFWDLRQLRPGDEVIVTTAQGAELRFVVRDLESYAYNDAPLDQIFGPSSQIGLNLITCNGTFDRGSHNYDQRLVVYTTLAA